jgi:hypothetical protein
MILKLLKAIGQLMFNRMRFDCRGQLSGFLPPPAAANAG